LAFLIRLTPVLLHDGGAADNKTAINGVVNIYGHRLGIYIPPLPAMNTY